MRAIGRRRTEGTDPVASDLGWRDAFRRVRFGPSTAPTSAVPVTHEPSGSHGNTGVLRIVSVIFVEPTIGGAVR